MAGRSAAVSAAGLVKVFYMPHISDLDQRIGAARAQNVENAKELYEALKQQKLRRIVDAQVWHAWEHAGGLKNMDSAVRGPIHRRSQRSLSATSQPQSQPRPIPGGS